MSPIVVAGSGGSGTRAVASFLARAGVDLGTKLNASCDALSFTPVLEASINSVLSETRSLDYEPCSIPTELMRAIVDGLARAVEEHRDSRAAPGSSQWGFKNPRQIFLIPILHAVYPDMRLVHVVRDGRDMIHSRNQSQRDKHFGCLFPDDRTSTPLEASAKMWAAVNGQAADFAERMLGPRYIRVRIEDLCSRTSDESAATLAAALSLAPETVAESAAVFEAKHTFGRWRDQPKFSDASGLFARSLQRFGYTQGPTDG